MAVRPHFVVGVIDPDDRVRNAVAAVLYLELGIFCILAKDVVHLMALSQGRPLDILIVGDHPASGSEVSAVTTLISRFPNTPLVALRDEVKDIAGADVCLARHLDAEMLIETISSMLPRPAVVLQQDRRNV